MVCLMVLRGMLRLTIVLVVLEKRLAELGGQRDASLRVETIPVSAAEGAQGGHEQAIGRKGEGAQEGAVKEGNRRAVAP